MFLNQRNGAVEGENAYESRGTACERQLNLAVGGAAGLSPVMPAHRNGYRKGSSWPLTCSHKRRPGSRQSGRRRHGRHRRQRERLRARQAAVVHRVASSPTVLRVRKKARHTRHVQLTDLKAVVRLRETCVPRKERRITETYLKFPGAR